MSPSSRRGRRTAPLTFAAVCRLVKRLPGIEEATSYGTPSLKVRGKFLARLKEDGVTMAVKVGSMEERDFLLRADPRVFFITDHYKDYPAVLVRLATVKADVIFALLEDSWRHVAPRTLVREYQQAR